MLGSVEDCAVDEAVEELLAGAAVVGLEDDGIELVDEGLVELLGVAAVVGLLDDGGGA